MFSLYFHLINVIISIFLQDYSYKQQDDCKHIPILIPLQSNLLSFSAVRAVGIALNPLFFTSGNLGRGSQNTNHLIFENNLTPTAVLKEA